MIRKTTPAPFLLCILAACGSTSNSPEQTVEPIEALSFAEFTDLGNDLYDTYSNDIFRETYIGADQLPDTQSANYSGFIGIGDEGVIDGTAVIDAAGQLNVNVDFTASEDQIKGVASNFFAFEATPLPLAGSLDLEASVIGSSGRVGGTLRGAINSLSGDPVDIAVAIEGGFLGTDAEAFAGIGTGTAVLSGTGGGERIGVIFAAEQ